MVIICDDHIIHSYSYISDMIWQPAISDLITHPSNGDCWRTSWELLHCPEYLLMPSFFLDEWQPYIQRTSLITGIYMSLSNSVNVSTNNASYKAHE